MHDPIASLFGGSLRPMTHQAEDVRRLWPFPRNHVWNELGTGKTLTCVWLYFARWLAGQIDYVILVGPGLVLDDWRDSFCGGGMPGELVDFVDCTPPNYTEIWSRLSGPRPDRFTVLATTYGGVRALMRDQSSARYKTLPRHHKLMAVLRGSRSALVIDEAQGAALPGSNQGEACRALAAECFAVSDVTATPIGNVLQCRLYGLTALVRPSLLMRPSLCEMEKPDRRPAPGTFGAFKGRYYVLRDPIQTKRPGTPFVSARAYPITPYMERLRAEIIDPQAPFTVRRAKADCLDLPEKIYTPRYIKLSPTVQAIMDSLIDDDRALLADGSAVVPDNILEEKLRTVELCGGWLSGKLVHTEKMLALRDVAHGLLDDLGDTAPLLCWASRTREVMACAGVLDLVFRARNGSKGADSEESIGRMASAVTEAFSETPSGWNLIGRAYESFASSLRYVRMIHGPVSMDDRRRAQSEWRDGRVRAVVAHPGVAGAGLNWQHVKWTMYYGQPLGTIARSQSEDRVHRKGLEHIAGYTDLCVYNGPDHAVYKAHRQQRSVSDSLLSWMASRR